MKKNLLSLFIFVGLLFGWDGNVFAVDSFSDNFDSYDNGALSGQGGWNYMVSTPLVESTVFNSFPKAVSLASSGGAVGYHSIDNIAVDGVSSFSFNYRMTSNNVSQLYFYVMNSSNNVICQIRQRTSGELWVQSGSSYQVLGSPSINVWHNVVLYLDFDSDVCYASLDLGAVSGDVLMQYSNDTSTIRVEKTTGSCTFYIDDINYSPPAEISITYPVDESSSKFEYFTVDVESTGNGYDKLVLQTRYATTQYCAENDCNSSHYTTPKTIGECDGEDSIYDGTTNLTRLTIPDGSVVYAKAYLLGVKSDTCIGNGEQGPEVYEILSDSPTIWFNYDTDYLEGITNSDSYWAGSWEDRWGAATSTIAYQGAATFFDAVTGPVLNFAGKWSSFFDQNQATEWGNNVSNAFMTIFGKVKDFINVIPGCQIILIIIIAIIVDLAIFIFKSLVKFRNVARP